MGLLWWLLLGWLPTVAPISIWLLLSISSCNYGLRLRRVLLLGFSRNHWYLVLVLIVVRPTSQNLVCFFLCLLGLFLVVSVLKVAYVY